MKIRETVIPERVGDSKLWASFTHIIGGGPLLLRNSITSVTESYKREGFDAAFHSFWHPRTAVGKKEDGTLLFVTITGTKPFVRRGVKLQQLAKLFLEWGATDAVNLDGGFSSMMVIRNEVVSIKREIPARALSKGKPKPATPDKPPENKPKLASADKSPEKNAKPVSQDKRPEKNTKPAAPDKQQPKKAAPANNTKTARGNRRIRPTPRFQGRAVSDAILIFPRRSDVSK